MKLELEYPPIKLTQIMLDELSKWLDEILENDVNKPLDGFEVSEMLAYDNGDFFDFSNATFDEVIKAVGFCINKNVGINVEVVEEK
jgi:hypothetical protein